VLHSTRLCRRPERGNQGLYLTELSPHLAQVLIEIIGRQASELADTVAGRDDLIRPPAETADMEVWEHHIEQVIENSPGLSETERESLIVSRRGQGLFKDRVMRIERFCRVTKVENPSGHHCKPIRFSTLQGCRVDICASLDRRSVQIRYSAHLFFFLHLGDWRVFGESARFSLVNLIYVRLRNTRRIIGPRP